MRKPKELTELDLATIASKVRRRLGDKFGNQRVSAFLTHDVEMTTELLHATYVAVREQIEVEAASLLPNQYEAKK